MKDPNYGKVEMIGGKSYLEWKKYLYFTDKQWKEIKPYFRVVDSADEVDGVVDGVWIYFDKGKENIAFTGRFASYSFSNEEVMEEMLIEPHYRMVDSPDLIDDSIDAVWKYKDERGNVRISYTGKAAQSVFDGIDLFCDDSFSNTNN